MSGLNFVKSNNEIDNMLNGKAAEEKNNSKTTNKNHNLENISMDTPMDPSSSLNDSERRVFTMPPHPVASQHYYRKLFSDQESTRKEETPNGIDPTNNNNLKSNSGNPLYAPMAPLGYPNAGFITPYAQPVYTMMPHQHFPTASYAQPIGNSPLPTISSLVTDSLISLVKYLIFFLLSLGIFKVGKRWILYLLKNYRIVENVPKRKESELVVNPEFKIEKKEEEETSNNESPSSKEQHKENAKGSLNSEITSLEFNNMMFLQREIYDLKLCMNEMKTKMGEMNNQSISNTLLKQLELQHEQQKIILSQTLSKHDNSTASNELQREINNLRNDMSQMKGMMMVNHQPYTVSPPIVHREPVQYYNPKYSTEAISPATSTNSNDKLIEHNLTSSAKIRTSPSTGRKEEEKVPSPVNNYFNSYSTTDPTNYETGMSKRSQPVVTTTSSISSQIVEDNSGSSPTEQQEESKTSPNDDKKNEESPFEYAQTFEPITEEEYDQVYGEYLNSLGKRFEDQLNFHTHVDPPSTSTTAEKSEENTTQESNPSEDAIITPSEEKEDKTTENNAENPSTSIPFGEVDVFNILKTPTLSFDELFVKASPKQPTETPSNVFNDISPVAQENTTESPPSFISPLASSSIQEAARELRKTQLTDRQKKSKIFGVLLAPEKKKKKKKPTKEVKSATTPEVQETISELPTSNTLSIETNVLTECENPVENVFVGSDKPPIEETVQEIPISMNTLSPSVIEPEVSKESFDKFESYDFDKDERFQRMLSLSADDEDCPVNKDDPNFLLMQKGIYFKQLLGNDEFDLESYLRVKGIEINQEN